MSYNEIYNKKNYFSFASQGEVTYEKLSNIYELRYQRVRLSWFGYLHRMPEDRMVKRVYKQKPMLTRPLGRPKNRWENDIINDIKKLKINNWPSCIQDRNKWKLYGMEEDIKT